jgi:hypothetical protein
MSVQLTDAQLLHYREHGYLVIPDLLSKEDVDAFLKCDRQSPKCGW